MSKQTWVDFKALKAHVGIKDVLGHYGVLETLIQKGERLVGPCPLHHGTNKQQFSVSLTKNAWNCFGDCHTGGNILDFVAAKEDVELRPAALLVQEWFPEGQTGERQTPPPLETSAPSGQRVREEKTVAQSPEPDRPTVNTPLTFVLKGLERKHAYLAERRFTPDTIQEFGLGYCKRGMMKGRVVIPIYNVAGELVAYAGRWPGSDVPEGEGKYKLPAEFHKSLEVFNLHRVHEHAAEEGLIVVEGFFDVMRLWQANVRNVVALMGTALSEEQEQLLRDAVGANGRISLMFDEDEAGWACRDEVLERLSRSVFVKVIELGEEGRQPDEMAESELTLLCK